MKIKIIRHTEQIVEAETEEDFYAKYESGVYEEDCHAEEEVKIIFIK